MTTLDELFPPADLKAEIDGGYVARKQHPTLPLSIMTYTQAAQYERRWNHVTRRCRGLIADDATGRIVAWCLPKFFNLSEHDGGAPYAPPLPTDEPFEVFDKVDGCFEARTSLNLWGGGTITIGEVVRKKLPVTLVGMDGHGNLAPALVTDWHRNGRKDRWLDITVDSNVSRTSGAGGHPNRLRVTPNHQILVNGKYVPAIEVRPGDEIVTQSWRPSESVLNLVRASLLGDGCVTPGALKPSLKAKYQEPHELKQLGYVEALRKALGDCGAVRCETVSGYGSKLAWAGSREYEALGDLRREWYPDGVRRLPQDLSWINDFAVAKWYMDDGSRSHSELQRDRMQFATNRFPEQDVRRLAALLTARYGVSCSVYYSKGWCLRVNAGRDHSIDRMWMAIAPHVHPALRYKLPEVWRDVPYIEMDAGFEIPVPKTAHVVSVEPVAPTKANFPFGRIGYDITTTTHNYMARGILVHNSLGLVFHYGGGWHAASKGSFISEQACWAQSWLTKTGADPALNPGSTYLAEIVYPENRIVVNNGDERTLVLLAVYDEYGNEHPAISYADQWEALGGRIVRSWRSVPLSELARMAAENRKFDGTVATGTDAEGWVVRFTSGVRVKCKFADYVKIHALVTGTNERSIWEVLAAGQDFADLFEQVPDEFRDWAVKVADRLRTEVVAWIAGAQADFDRIGRLPDRKAFAIEAVKSEYKAALFRFYDGRDADDLAWKSCRPRGDTPYAVDEEG